LTDGATTEVEGKGLSEGMEVVIGLQAKSVQQQAGVSNPFTPKFRASRGGKTSK
jgi:hypothetical protein